MSTMDTAFGVPHPHLEGLVGRYTGYRLQGFAPGIHRGLPSRGVVIEMSLAGPFRVSANGTHNEHMAFIAGLDDRTATLSHDGFQYGVHLELTPAGARSLLGSPSAELAGSVVDLDLVLGKRAGELAERMAAASTWQARFAILDAVLCRRHGQLAPAPSYLAHAWDRIIDGAARVRDLAGVLGYSERHLRQKFTAEYGLSPKAVARIARFERSRWVLQRPDPPSLADVAAVCGYYDQAHLARDWKDLAGCPASVWLATENLPAYDNATSLAAK